MSVCGGYILCGVDGRGNTTGQLDTTDLRAFDEATLRPKLQRYLPASVTIRASIVERDGHKVVAICVLPNPKGCAIFEADGNYQAPDGTVKTVFRKGEIL